VPKPVESSKVAHPKEPGKDASMTRILISGLSADGVAQLCTLLESQRLPAPEKVASSLVAPDDTVAYFADPLLADEFFECVNGLKARGHPQAISVTLRWR
jgi:hypothetical protein